MNYGDICTGLSAASLAWHSLGWNPVWFSEIEPFPCKVLKHHYPNVPNLGNMLHLNKNKIYNESTIDLLVGGTPCQSFSVAGLRKGLASENGNLAIEFCRILIAKQPRWFVWENVPGALSSFSYETDGESMDGTGPENGRTITETADFATILTAFRECGYSCAYRILDAQYFGVPQRRRRIFVVGYLGDDWRPPAAVLFDGEGMSRDTEKGRKKGEETTGTIIARAKGRSPGIEAAAAGQIIVSALTRTGVGTCGADDNQGQAGHLLPCWWDGGQTSQTLDRVLSKGQTMPEKNRFPAVLCYPFNQLPGDPAPTLNKSGVHMIVPAVRRLTPLECERLQGFPDNYTNIPGASDTARYQAIGNSMAVPCMHWIGKRIDLVDKYLKNENNIKGL